MALSQQDNIPSSGAVIGMVLSTPYPDNLRVKREAQALIEAGYTVHLMCLLQAGELIDAWEGDLHVHRIAPDAVHWTVPVINQPLQWPFKGVLSDFVQAMWAVDMRWYKHIVDAVQRYKIDVLHVHDVPLLPTCQWVSQQWNIPVIADLNENYPALLGYQLSQGNPVIQRRIEEKWLRIERDALHRADHILVPTQAAIQRLEKSWVDTNHVTVVSNAVDIDQYAQVLPDLGVAHQYKNRFVVAYAGQLDESFRGVGLFIQALPALLADIPNISLVLVGKTDSQYAHELLTLADELGVSDYVELIVGLTEEDVVHYLDVADVCVWPYLKESYTEAVFPNKLTLAQWLGKPIIVSDCAPLADYIEYSGGGRVVPSGDVDALVHAILYLHRDMDMRCRYGDAGRQWVTHHAHWGLAKQTLLNVYSAAFEPTLV